MTGNQIRKTFLDYFAARGHRVVKSSPLVPANDPTLLFTNAGMNQFKDVFLGLEQRDYTRAASSQKCMRAGGKHNDLENVGRTRRHLTFFEMLGNFSFGDYFKKEAIEYAWELVTREFGISKDRLYATVLGGGALSTLEIRDGVVLGDNWIPLPKDEEAANHWAGTGISTDHIKFMDQKDNFWMMGDTGPCGPCSEIHYDLGPEASDEGHTDCEFPCECGRYVEIWNLVFMQFNRDANGYLTNLPKPSIDTGMGLERLAAVLQGKLSNFETDLLWPLIEGAGAMIGKEYGEKPEVDVSLRILADHSRAAAFLIHDGVLPANDGRGYVLRKVLRRAARHGSQLGFSEPFLYKLTGKVAEIMSDAYPELLETTQRVAAVVKSEEERFAHTMTIALQEFDKVASDEVRRASKGIDGMVLAKAQDLVKQRYQGFDGMVLAMAEQIIKQRSQGLEGMAREMANQQSKGVEGIVRDIAREKLREIEALKSFALPGEKLFRLYDTFGMPLDWIKEIAGERSLAVDEAGFEAEMRRQRERARASWKGVAKEVLSPVYAEVLKKGKTVFEGYQATTSHDCTVLALLHEGSLVEELPAGAKAEIVLDHTPFYAEAGGQVGDTGVLLNEASQEVIANVEDTYYPVSGLIAHRVLTSAPLRVGDRLTAVADADKRRATKRNHTGTHLLHAALRNVLGTHVKQAGSVVEPSRLRFDFSHFASVSELELEEIEKLANEEIVKNTPVETAVMDLDHAIESGALAFFGEKYPDRVRVVNVTGFSKELCGGTHVSRTGDIGLLKITSEGSISAGVRRVEAVTGEGALERYREVTTLVRNLAATLKTTPLDLPDVAEKLVESQKNLEKQVETLRMKLAQAQLADVESRVRSVKDVKVLSIRLEALERGQMRTLADSLRQRLQSGVVVLATTGDGKVALIAALTPDLTKRLHAGKIAQAVAQKLGGTGGGRPDIAEAGGKDPTRLDTVLNEVYEIVGAML